MCGIFIGYLKNSVFKRNCVIKASKRLRLDLRSVHVERLDILSLNLSQGRIESLTKVVLKMLGVTICCLHAPVIAN